ncbi:terminase small subunit [Candidatus Peregrinibacteria bacterium]|jgi:hypothetical protein|nr:terminase small subunit [Candidatus Peregrinibacteria bacterium]
MTKYNTQEMSITFKQAKFCKEYIKSDGNATQAYKNAYNKPVSIAQVEGHKNLRKPNVKAEIMRITQGAGITSDWIKKIHAERAVDPTRSESSQDRNLRNLGEMAQLYKNPEDDAKVQVLNINNITQFIEQNYGDKHEQVGGDVEPLKDYSEMQSTCI